MHTVPLPRLGTFEAWRAAARQLAAARVPAAQVSWQMEGAAQSLFDGAATALPEGAHPVTVPRDFPALARQLTAHRADGAIDLAYTLLLRLQDQPRLLSNRADADMARAAALAKNIRRDMHKMKAFLRFREVTPQGANRRQFLSWFEPDNRIEELITGFFTRRFADMDWVIVTPEVTTRFTGGEVTHEAVQTAKLDLSDETEELWKTYYANIFNPARLKIKAMQSEMPKKYWKNLPEAVLIPGLIAAAEQKVALMHATAPTLPPLRAAKILRALEGKADTEPPEGSDQAPQG